MYITLTLKCNNLNYNFILFIIILLTTIIAQYRIADCNPLPPPPELGFCDTVHDLY